MTNVIKPMLAKEPKYDDKGNPVVTYPVIVQPKLDGIRCLIVDGVARSRTFKPIPNQEIQAALGRPEFEGLDGELIVGEPTDEGCMQATASFVMAPGKTGEGWTYHVFDLWDKPGDDYVQRNSLLVLAQKGWPDNIERVAGFLAVDEMTLLSLEAGLVGEGHEGIIVRDPSAPYKHGRSGVKGPLLKVKRFIDFEAEILGVYEEQENTNEATKDAFGRTERSTKKAGKVGKGCLGGFELRALNGPCEGVEFRCGTGFTREQRETFWRQHKGTWGQFPTGQIAKIKSFPVGVKDAPRFPVFLGFRDMEVDG